MRRHIISFFLVCILIGLPKTMLANYEEGYSLFKADNYQKSYDILLPLAQSGDAQSQLVIGYLVEVGVDLKGNQPNPCKWDSQRFADPIKEPDKYASSPIYFEPMPKEQRKECGLLVAEWLLKSAESGNAEAQLRLAEFYDGFYGNPKDSKHEIYWLKMSAKNNNGDAQGRLGYKYLAGNGVAKDYDLALTLLRQAIDSGKQTYATWIGKIYEEGLGVQADIDKAIENYTLGLKHGNFHAGDLLNKLYEEGVLVPKNIIEQYKWNDITWKRTYFNPALDRTRKLEKVMSAKELNEAKKLVEEWLKDNSLTRN